ncbi:hypothetical protein WR25_09444 isoform C [Diploscapter pachys]|uniref:Bestrophin homolog n=1 Tax=Diploscapter pachys TaxID=2018661 RepID=A0A2A2K3M9_9BILA|nr:hypothetical protein WR25_09444 isoform B [Diploscapter pachys]PAV68606.1 hypothetical protein WR25_09444 isoform C [Diploscapter pachys]
MCDGYTRLIPLTFLLGFYVSNVVSRWWSQFQNLNWPEDILSILCTFMTANDEKTQKRRHAIARYLNLSMALVLRDVSSKVRLRFPHVSSFIAAGLLTEKEYERIEKLDEECFNVRWLTPLHWVQQILRKEEEENKPTTSLFNHCITELKIFRQQLRRIYAYDWINVPLVYTQVAAIATYSFFLFTLFGRQTLLPEIKAGKEVDVIIPIFTIVQFLFFVGWFKVGQDLMRPWGQDDDDFELNYILDRNIAMSFAIVDRLQTEEIDEMDEDMFWKDRENQLPRLPHTTQSRMLHEHAPKLHSYVAIGEKDEENSCRATCINSSKRKRLVE